MEQFVILGTAGHVDHGKTALVKALTGVDTDRLAEEKRRGITIDLGFAPLRLADDLTIGVVDVPGHEAFVRNMLAGATGIDLALLVVAADEGVMPQTREHLAILHLLGIRSGVIALSKADLADEEWMTLVQDDVRHSVANTPLAQAPIVTTSVFTGEGIESLRDAVRDAARELPERDGSDLFRLPVDRAFTVRGTGTVATGTVWSGVLGREDTVRILPGDRIARVRGIQAHGLTVDEARPGMRAAVALAGVDVSELSRGMVLVSDNAWLATRAILAEVALLDSARRPLGPRTRVRFHLGTAEVGARVVTTGGAVEPGETKQARLLLDDPIVARAGDRFVLRSSSPLATIGGGVVNDPMPQHRRARPWPRSVTTPAGRLANLLLDAGARGVGTRSLPLRLGIPASAVERILAEADPAVHRIGEVLYGRAVVGSMASRLSSLVDGYHARFPLEAGAPLQSVRSQLGGDASIVEEVLRTSVRGEELEITGGLVARSGWVPRLTSSQALVRRALLKALDAAGREPPSVAELATTYGPDTAPLLRLLEREGVVTQVEVERFFARSAVERLISALRSGMATGREYGPAELRDLLGFSRKYLIPFLEYCDRNHVTERRSGGRVIVDM